MCIRDRVVALAAIDDTEHILRTRENNCKGLAFLREQLDRLGLQYVNSSANFLLVRIGADLPEKLLYQGIIIRPMNGYGYPDYARVSIGLPEENERFISALERSLQ